MDAAAKIKATKPDIIPLALPLGPEEAQAEFLIWAGGNGGDYFKDGKWVVNSPGERRDAELPQELVDAGLHPAQPGDHQPHRWRMAAVRAGQGGDDQRRHLPARRAREGEARRSTTASRRSRAADGKSSVTLGVQDYFFGFKKEGNQEAIQKFLSFLYQPDNYAGFLKAAGGFLPATKSRLVPPMASDPAMKPFIDVLPSAIFYPGDQASWPAVQGAIQTDHRHRRRRAPTRSRCWTRSRRSRPGSSRRPLIPDTRTSTRGGPCPVGRGPHASHSGERNG